MKGATGHPSSSASRALSTVSHAFLKGRRVYEKRGPRDEHPGPSVMPRPALVRQDGPPSPLRQVHVVRGPASSHLLGRCRVCAWIFQDNGVLICPLRRSDFARITKLVLDPALCRNQIWQYCKFYHVYVKVNNRPRCQPCRSRNNNMCASVAFNEW